MMKYIKMKLACILAALLIICLSGCAAQNAADVIDSTSADVLDTGVISQASEFDAIPAEPDLVPEGVVLVIYGDGMDGQTNWTLEQLQALEDGYREITYSTTNNWPTLSHTIGHGVSLPYLLAQAGIREDAETLTFLSPDGYQAKITREQLYGVQYAYAEHSPAGSGNTVEVEPIIAWSSGASGAVPNSLRPIFGQRGPNDTNTAASVKDLHRIEVSTRSAGAWDIPSAGIPSGSAVPVGTALELMHPNLDNLKLYYTTDGSDPDYYSLVYNKSTTYFQPDLIVPISINEDVTIKVFAGGLGKADSGVVTFTYKVN